MVKNNLDPSKNQVDAIIALFAFILALNGMDGWGWLILLLFIRN